MSLLGSSKRYWTSLTQGSSMTLLLIIPKCSLCLFTITNAITVCGIKPMITPIWEFLLVGLFVLIQLAITLFEMRNNFRLIPMIISALGLAAFVAFLFFNQPASYYYMGVLLLAIGWIAARILKLIAGKAHCQRAGRESTFIP